MVLEGDLYGYQHSSGSAGVQKRSRCLSGRLLLKMTYFGELNTVLVIMAVIYWSVNKDIGTYLLMGWSGNRILNGALKVTFCSCFIQMFYVSFIFPWCIRFLEKNRIKSYKK